MTVHKRKKVTRYRGHQTHGGGAKKKRRGAGHRGGRGRAGTGKRADSKKPTIWKDKYYFGKHGFKKKNKTIIKAINLKTLEERLPTWVQKGLAEEKAGSYSIDLGKLGYNKLIGSGRIRKKIIISVERATQGAIDSISEAGGNVQLTFKLKKKEVKDTKETEENKIGKDKEEPKGE